MDALYYSNFCKHSKELLTVIAKSDIKKNIYFICIDKRKMKSGAMYICLENGKEIKLPDVIKSVPSMLLFSRGNLLLTGNSIYNYIKEYERNNKTMIDEPNAFSLNFNSFSSDTYSFIDSDPDEMNAKGNAGSNQMHNYVSVNYMDNVTTPPENYVSKRTELSDGGALEKYMNDRDKELPKHPNPLTGQR